VTVLCDTSPLNYLILIGRVEILPALFGKIVVPVATLAVENQQQFPWLSNAMPICC